MDKERIERIILRLNEKQETHPTFANLWLKYLDNKLFSFEKSLNDCERLLDNTMEEDPDIISIAATYIICRALTANTT
jgi:hypothetical protein